MRMLMYLLCGLSTALALSCDPLLSDWSSCKDGWQTRVVIRVVNRRHRTARSSIYIRHEDDPDAGGNHDTADHDAHAVFVSDPLIKIRKPDPTLIMTTESTSSSDEDTTSVKPRKPDPTLIKTTESTSSSVEDTSSVKPAVSIDPSLVRFKPGGADMTKGSDDGIDPSRSGPCTDILHPPILKRPCVEGQVDMQSTSSGDGADLIAMVEELAASGKQDLADTDLVAGNVLGKIPASMREQVYVASVLDGTNSGSALSADMKFSVKGKYGTLDISRDGKWTYGIDRKNPLVKAFGKRPGLLVDVFGLTTQVSGGVGSKPVVLALNIWEYN